MFWDKVVAGNVIHLLDNPVEALKELERVCKPSGKIIIPTYVNIKKTGKLNILVSIFDKLGANFKKQFDYNTYKDFFEKAGYKQVEYRLVEGRMPCAIAIITKQ